MWRYHRGGGFFFGTTAAGSQQEHGKNEITCDFFHSLCTHFFIIMVFIRIFVFFCKGKKDEKLLKGSCMGQDSLSREIYAIDDGRALIE